MRSLLNLGRESLATLSPVSWQNILQRASQCLMILDPVLGEAELVRSVAAELAKLTASIAKNNQRQ